MFFQNGGGTNGIKLTKSGQGEILRPAIERSDRPEARQNSGLGWRGHKKPTKINLLLNIQNSKNSGTKHNFSKKFSAHLPGQNGDLGLYFRPVNLISPKSAKTLRKIEKLQLLKIYQQYNLHTYNTETRTVLNGYIKLIIDTYRYVFRNTIIPQRQTSFCIQNNS